MLEGPEGAPLAPQGIDKLPLAILGPTASGKTELALRLAGRVGADVVSIDSRQIYKRLDAATAKPLGRWRGGDFIVEDVRCRLIDLLEPCEEVDAARYAALARKALAEAGERPAVLAGGAGMYLQALFNGLDPLPPRSNELRRRVQERIEAEGIAASAARLRGVDPEGGAWAGENPRRVARALEVYEASGRPIASFWTGAFLRDIGPDRAVLVGLEVPTEELDRRIEARAKAFWPPLLEEVRDLLKGGLPPEAPGLRSLGYPEAISVVNGERASDEGLAALIHATRRYARRQRIWFRRYKHLKPVDPAEPGLDEKILAWWERRT